MESVHEIPEQSGVPDERYEIQRIVQDDIPCEVWVDKRTGKKERIIRFFSEGMREEHIFNPQTEEPKTLSFFDKDGSLILFEDIENMRKVIEEEEQRREQAYRFPPYIRSVEEELYEADRQLFDALRALTPESGDEKGN